MRWQNISRIPVESNMAAGERGDGVVADRAARPRLKLGWVCSLAGTLFVPSKGFQGSSSAPHLGSRE